MTDYDLPHTIEVMFRCPRTGSQTGGTGRSGSRPPGRLVKRPSATDRSREGIGTEASIVRLRRLLRRPIDAGHRLHVLRREVGATPHALAQEDLWERWWPKVIGWPPRWRQCCGASCPEIYPGGNDPDTSNPHK